MMNVPCAVWDIRMIEQRIQLQPAYILHQRPYRDTSALIELFTPEYGRVGVVAKGVKGSRSRWRGLLQGFQPLLVSWYIRGELGTLTTAEPQGQALTISPAFIASGFYLNEILMRLLTRHDPQEALFEGYDMTLRSISRIPATSTDAQQLLEVQLRSFELHLLRELGYGLILDMVVNTGKSIHADETYLYHVDRGPVLFGAGSVARDQEGIRVKGKTLLALQENDFADEEVRREAKRLLRGVLGKHLGPKPLHSRQLMQSSRKVTSIEVKNTAVKTN